MRKAFWILLASLALPVAAKAQTACDLASKVGPLSLSGGETILVASIPVITDGEFASSLVLTDRRLIAAPHPDVPGVMEAPDEAELFSPPLRSFDRESILGARSNSGTLWVKALFRRGNQTAEREISMEFCPTQSRLVRDLVRHLGGSSQ